MSTKFLRLRGTIIASFTIAFLIVAFMLWFARDEFAFLHPNKVQVSFAFDDRVSAASIGADRLDISSGSTSIWLKKGVYELRVVRADKFTAEPVEVEGEMYILVEGAGPFVRKD